MPLTQLNGFAIYLRFELPSFSPNPICSIIESASLRLLTDVVTERRLEALVNIGFYRPDVFVANYWLRIGERGAQIESLLTEVGFLGQLAKNSVVLAEYLDVPVGCFRNQIIA